MYTNKIKMAKTLKNIVINEDTMFKNIYGFEAKDIESAKKRGQYSFAKEILAKGQELFSKKQSASFEESIDLACEALKSQIKKHKEKLLSKN